MKINCGLIMDDISDNFPVFCIQKLNLKKTLSNSNDLFHNENTDDNTIKLIHFLVQQSGK